MKGFTPVILIALAIGLFYFYISPTYDEVKALEVEQDRYSEALDVADELQDLKGSLLNTYNGFSAADLNRLRKFLPENIDDVRLVVDVNSIARENGILIEDILIGDEQNVEGRRRIVDASSQMVNTLKLQITFNATYSQFVSFMSDMESSLRIINVVGINFDSTELVGNGYTFVVNLETYWAK